jgi:hypothetical protein
MSWYRKLDPIKEGNRKLRFLTTCIDSLPLYGKAKKHPPCFMKCKKGVVRAWIADGRLNWNPDYAWNGCSPKYYVGYPPLGKWVGTPDFERTRKSSLGHDILFQFSTLLHISFDEANKLFLLWMEDAEFDLAEQYYDAVDSFGRNYWGKDLEGLNVTYL